MLVTRAVAPPVFTSPRRRRVRVQHGVLLASRSTAEGAAMKPATSSGRSGFLEPDVRIAYREYGSSLLGFAMNEVGDRGLAEELVQEVFVRAGGRASGRTLDVRPCAPGCSPSPATS